uniref:Spike glycoprotein n=1 Tax=Alphacoronavirus sp. TaxID=1906673 RepID=A0A8F0ZUA8_9ALPC|nr:spike glycoprotein [Alphacoronavirus sp.]
MISLAVFLAELLVIISKLPPVLLNSPADLCSWDAGEKPTIDLGLPPNSTVFVSGYLPTPENQWHCKTGLVSYENVHGFFWSYYAQAENVAIGVSSADLTNNRDQWAVYIWQRNNGGGNARLKICKWTATYVPSYDPHFERGACIVNIRFTMQFYHTGKQVVGLTWNGDIVTIYGLSKTYRFHLANNWSRVTVQCQTPQSCGILPVYNVTTLNITTDAYGRIATYSVCESCDGFPAHVFPVGDGGYIPIDFDFTNWFVLTNKSTIVQGRTTTIQPLRLLCLWPVPVLLATDNPIYFNLSKSEGVRCNGFRTEGVADVLRFSLNFTQSQVLNGVHNIVFNTDYSNYTFTCTNDTVIGNGRSMVPFGFLDEVYRCFVLTQTLNGTISNFVGVLPPVTREFVVSRFGAVYVNGVRMMSLPPLDSVIFNVTSSVGSDFWTVAFANDAEVLLDINATNIVGLQYCDSHVDKLKCSQLSYTLSDGFYTASSLVKTSLYRTYVALPYHATHTDVELNVTMRFTGHSITLNGQNSGVVCVNTSQFTTKLHTNADPTYHGDVTNVDCPFNFYSLNNYLAFGTICFSLQPLASSCSMSIDSVILGYHQPLGVLYISHSSGSTTTGMPRSTGGVYDSSVVYTGVCTDYTIYGVTGRGIITELNTTIIAGLYYTSVSGQLLGFKNATNGVVYAVRPCDLSSQVAVYEDNIIGVVSSEPNVTFGFNNTLQLPNFYYHSNSLDNCSEPVLTYGSIGVCSDGSITQVQVRKSEPQPATPILTGQINIPSNFSLSVQVEYLQMHMQPVSVDCSRYVCNGNSHCLRLLTQYVSACKNIEDALQLSARLESMEINSAITISDNALQLANVSNFDYFNMSALLPRKNGKSAIEDLLFNKVVTSGLGTVDQDYKKCIQDSGLADVADLACAQYYNGIMVLPGVVDEVKMGLYTASLTGAMVLGGFTAAAAIPFSLAVQSRLNYVALQTDVLQQNQKILADSFNSAMSNITLAFTEVNEALKDTSEAINTVAQALNKVQTVVNEQGQALAQLTRQLASNFQAISSSIEDIYNRLDVLAADAQVDRLISGRLSALNAFVTQTLTKYTDVRASRQLALQKINECVKSQSSRYGFCGNGTHLFSIANAAPNGIMLFHTVLVPTQYVAVSAWAGICVSGSGFVLRDVKSALFNVNDTYYITSRDMYEPRIPQSSDFVRITGCIVTYLNLSSDELSQVIPDYIDVNKTLEDFAQNMPNYSVPNLDLGVYNYTILNLTTEIDLLQNKSDQLLASTVRLQELIDNLNKTYVDLEWLNRFEQYVKWPWYVWLAIFLAIILFSFLMLYCCCATGCCGCLSCLSSSCDCGKNLQHYEVEKVHIQ